MPTTHRTACPLDCPDSCALEIQVESGRLVEVDAAPDSHALTGGFICGKVRRIRRHLECAERLSTPLLRSGPRGSGDFEAVSWEHALDVVTERLRSLRADSAADSLLPVCYGGSNGILTQDALDRVFFERFGAARLLRTVCAAATGAAAQGLYGKMAGVALPDYIHSKLIVIWGANPSASGIHLVPIVQRARAAGAKLVVVDPRRTPLAKQADLHLAVQPGTDLPLALALLRHLFASGSADTDFLAAHATGVDELRAAAEAWTFERAAAACGVASAEIEQFAKMYSTVRPAVLRMGWGQERNRNGGFASAAILALPAVAGHFGVRGGGFTASNSNVWNDEIESPVEGEVPVAREVNMNRLGRELLEPDGSSIRALFVYNANPLATLPDQERVRRGMLRDDLFTVVHDAVMTDSALLADVVLPATTFLEQSDLHASYGAYALQAVEPVLRPHGESRSNHDVFAELITRLGLARDGDDFTLDALRAVALRNAPVAARAKLEARQAIEPEFGSTPIQFADVFPRTADGKIHLASSTFAEDTGPEMYGYRDIAHDDDFPLALISPATARTISSTFGQLGTAAELEMHPADGQARGLADGDVVRVHNRLGEVHCAVALDDDIAPGVVSLAKGLWSGQTLNGATSNALCPDSLTDLGGGACFNDARVEVERLES